MSNSTDKTILTVILIVIGIFILFTFFPIIFFFLGHSPLHEPGVGPWIGPWLFPTAIIIPTVLLIFVWIFLVVWVYRDAERRGMSGILWASLVFIGNIIGLLIYLIVRSEELPNRLGITPSEPCPTCGKPITQSFYFCPHCGARLKAACPSCEKPVSGDWRVCPHCGQKLVEEK